MIDKQKAIEIWKELNVERVVFEFSCGGDSMNDTSIFIFDKNGSEIDNVELRDFFDSETYNRVEFYVNSDGHYQGEAGEVEITLDEEDDDFSYCKSSQSEWCESVTNITEVELDEEEITFIKDKVLNINGGDGDFNLNYKMDCILSDKEEENVSSIREKMFSTLSRYCPDDVNDVDDWFSFTTNEEGDELEIEGNCIKVQITNQYTTYSDSE
jgi:hypothetical protein